MKMSDIHDILKKEQCYFEKWFREQERRGEVFKIKPRVKTTFKVSSNAIPHVKY
jgi:hypothetical protein